MDNQQAISEFERGWLSGLLDGEGHIGLVMGRPTKASVQLVPRIGIGMTSLETMDRVAELLTRLDIPHYRHSQKPQGTRRGMHYIVLAGFKRTKRFLVYFSDNLVTKAEQAHILRQYILRREQLPHPSPYQPVDWKDFDSLQQLNRGIRSESSEAIRQAGRKRAEDMVHAS